MANTHLILDTRRPLKDGTCPVRISVGHGTNLYLHTGVWVNPAEWDDRSQLALCKGATAINRSLSAISARVITRILDLRERGLWKKITRNQLKAMLTDTDISEPPAEEKKETTLSEMFRKVTEGMKPQTAKNYGITLRRIKAYCDPDTLPVSKVDAAWTDGFAKSLSDLGQNTRSTYLTRLKTVMIAAAREGIADDRGARSVRVKMRQTEMRDLSVDELRRIRDMDLKGDMAVARDMFMLIFYLIGINAADICALTPENVRNGRIEYRRAKTGRLYTIRIEPEAKAIIDKHKGRKQLLAPCERYADNPSRWSHWMEHRLSKMGVRDGLSNYFARYTWATLAASIDIPRDTISESLGHKYGADVTGGYIQFSRRKIDEANRKVIDFVNSQ